MKTITIEIDPATLTIGKKVALRGLNYVYHNNTNGVVHSTNGVKRIENEIVLGSDMVVYHVEVDESSPTFEGDAFFREDFLCGIMDVLDDYK